MEQLKDWTAKEIAKLRSYSMSSKPVTKSNSEIAEYLVSKKDDKAVESYVQKFFGNTNTTKEFTTEFLRKRRAIMSDSSLQKPYVCQDAPVGMKVLRSKKGEPEVVKKKPAPAKPRADPARAQKQPQKVDSGPRVLCNCFGTAHKALTNCLTCGRIVCEQEGYGPCPFCGSPVTKEGTEIGAYANSKEAAKAIELKDRLIKYDKTAAKRTTIYDDQEDYFTTSPWLSKDEIKSREEKAKQHELEKIKKEEAKKKMFISFNFGGQVVSVVTGSELEEKKEQEEEKEGKAEPKKKKTYDSDSDDDDGGVEAGNDADVAAAAAASESKSEERNGSENNGDDDDDFVVDDELEAEFITNEEFCPVKPKDVPFGVAANLSITAPVYHASACADTEVTQKDDDPFSGMNDKDHRRRVQHDYFAD